MKWPAFLQKKESVALLWTRLYLPLCMKVRDRERREMSEQEEEVVGTPIVSVIIHQMTNLGAKHITPTYTEQLFTQCTGATVVK